MKNKNQKRGCQIKRIKSAMVGLIIKWDDPEPCSYSNRLVNTVLTHRNAVHKLKAAGIYRNFQKCCTEVRMYYKVLITTVFKYENGVNAEIVREIKSFCLINEIEALSIELIEEAMREGDVKKFSHVTFEVECLSAYAPPKTPEELLCELLESAA